MCTEDLYEGKYRFLINKLESTGSKQCEDPKAFIEYSNNMDGLFESGDEYNPTKFQAKESINKWQLIIHRIMILKTL